MPLEVQKQQQGLWCVSASVVLLVYGLSSALITLEVSPDVRQSPIPATSLSSNHRARVPRTCTLITSPIVLAQNTANPSTLR